MNNDHKTLINHVETGAKYSGSSIALSAAITGLIVWAFPSTQEVAHHIALLLAFVLNLLIVVIFKVEISE